MLRNLIERSGHAMEWSEERANPGGSALGCRGSTRKERARQESPQGVGGSPALHDRQHGTLSVDLTGTMPAG